MCSGPYNGIVFSLKKEGNSDTCHNVDELEDIMLVKVVRQKRTNIV